jgi:hypothetical protein
MWQKWPHIQNEVHFQQISPEIFTGPKGKAKEDLSIYRVEMKMQ